MHKAAATTNPHESEAFAAKAAQLVARHRLDPDRLNLDPDGLEVRDIDLGRGAYVRARLALLGAVVDTHDARLVFGPTPTGTVAHVAGHRGDLDVIEVMYTSLHQQAAAQMAGTRRATSAATQRYRRSFLFGFATRTGELLADARRTVENHAFTSPTSSSSAIALRARQEQVDEFARASFGRVCTARAPNAAESSAWSAGAAAAQRADPGRRRIAGRRALGRSVP
jgi:hypothetical protein